ncbi:hypothetical protein QOZ80_8BG0666500 [Eleusine coracana subsp. coracana]|nr:hypothetical protein QOZ80_8BG0666500 [Eleusine coracana subsp. coracana]
MRASTTKRKWTGHDTGSLMQNQNAGNRQLLPGTISEAGSCNLGKFGDSSLSRLSKIVAARLSKYVVALASFSGDTQLSGCAGIFIRASCSKTLSILTSVSLVRSCDDDSKVLDNLTIKVRLSDNLIVIGWLQHYDLNYDLAVINIERLHGFCAPIISAGFQVHESNSKIVALGRCFNSGVLTISRVLEIGEPSSELCEAEICELSNELYEHMHSTYEVDKVWVGGPIVGFNGRLFGINCYCGGRAFLSRSRIVEFLENSGILRTDVNQGVDTNKTVSSVSDNFCDVSRRNGYPLPKMMRYDISEMRVFNSFEEEFDGDIWNKLSEEVSSTLSECVVALALFKGDVRHFACTGVFIDCYPARILTSASLIRNSGDKSNICDDLRIEVYLQNKSRVTATLKHYDLHYNVAVFEILCFRSLGAIKLEKDISFSPKADVVSVGCRFQCYKLMATKGVLVDKPCNLDCKELGTSTCNITKAGIGGPLIDRSGNFVGMNFFHEEETPFIPRKIIQELLKRFNAKWHKTDVSFKKGDPYRWPVPEPYWSLPLSSEL